MVKKESYFEAEHLQGGKGAARIYSIVPKEDFFGHASLYAKVVLPPGASIGRHTHIGETEPYYILKGKGDFTDNDMTVTTVQAGDICTILPGQSHGIENNYDEDLEFMALIYNA